VTAILASSCQASTHAASSSDPPSGNNIAPAGQPGDLHGAIPTTVQPRPKFVLADTVGRRYDFQAETQRHVTLLYFGYTHCPDECPTAMADVATALRDTGPQVAQQVQVVFVTTDPWRDTAKVLRHWLDAFHPPQPYVGLTGTPAQIAGAEVTMGMPISSREPAPKSYGSGRYSVSHFAAVMAYGRDDRLATVYPSGVSPTDIATDLKVLVKG
jgi:protein SCO1/2